MIKCSDLLNEVNKADIVFLWSKELNHYLEVDINSIAEILESCNPIFEFELLISYDQEREEDDFEKALYIDPHGVNPDSKL